VDDLWAMKSEDVGLIVRAIGFQDFNLSGHDPPTSQTDGQMDDMRSQDHNLKTSTCIVEAYRRVSVYIIRQQTDWVGGRSVVNL